jgi:hypothetical protein
MLPLLAVGGVIGAVMSVAKGASWVSDQLGLTSSATSAGGKAQPKPGTTGNTASVSQFEATLAAQVAGPSVPASTPNLASVTPVQPQYGTNYDALARINAGVSAYNHIGEHRDHQTQPPSADDNTTVARS